MKILFTSVGRRVELVEAFHKSAKRLNVDLTIIGADISETAPAMFFCDQRVLVPRISDSNYIPFLVNYCAENDVDLLIPTIDTDLLLLSENKDKFGKTRVLISNKDKVALCRDKRFTADYFISLGLLSPKPVDDVSNYTGGYPAFIKPKDGSSSIFAYRANNEAELFNFAKQVPDYIIQPFVDGVEYTVDVLCDFDGNPIFITPRIRLAVRSGEVLKTEIHQDEVIINEIKTLVADYKPYGQITVQLIKNKVTGKNYYIEINPRFGGGAPMTMMAGADSSEALIRLLLGERVNYLEGAAEDGAVFSRFDQSIRVN